MKSMLRSLLAAAMVAGFGAAASAEGLISIIVNDPANPYWLTEGNVAKATAEKLGYTANVSAHKGDTNTESNLIDTAITNKSVAIILDPANADGSVGAVKKAVAANIPVFLVNAEINQEGLAKAQLVSNNAQGAALGAQQWVRRSAKRASMSNSSAPRPTTTPPRARTATRPCSASIRISKRPPQEVANWDRTQGHDKMQSMLQANPDIIGVISGNDEMALGAIAALKEAGKLGRHQGRRLRRLAGCGCGHQGRRTAVHRASAGRRLLGRRPCSRPTSFIKTGNHRRRRPRSSCSTAC